jgi:hypothetical protein
MRKRDIGRHAVVDDQRHVVTEAQAAFDQRAKRTAAGDVVVDEQRRRRFEMRREAPRRLRVRRRA